MTADAPGFKVCYRHPNKVAVQNCHLCGRPICTQCAAESGDPLFCLPCKQDTMLHGDRLFQQDKDLKPAARQTPIEIGEVTVLDDGTVVQPGAPPTIRYEPEDDAGRPAAPPLTLDEQDATALNQLLLVEEATAEEAVSDETAAPVGETTSEVEPAASKIKSVMGRGPRTGVWSQMLYALRYAVGIGVLVAAAWLLIALGAKQWTQVSVFTMGIAVPWALFNATTRKKYLGLRVWIETPPVIYMSAASFAVVMVVSIAMEFLARWVIFGNRFVVSDFAQRYFKATDWVLVICGLLLSVLVPFVLKFGGDVSAPSFIRKAVKKSEQGDAREIEQKLDQELHQKLGEELEPGTEEKPKEADWD